MARPVPADLEDALAANPAARESFWAMPSEQKDAWIAWTERPRFRVRVAGASRRQSAGSVAGRRYARPRLLRLQPLRWRATTDGCGWPLLTRRGEDR